jgi:pimeloyl-ACP methyl ester carboxylesterase
MSFSDQLGEQKEISLDSGAIRYRERGSGEPIVFVHGLLVNGGLWRKVVPLLSKDFRCITPDWPLGSHELPMPASADLSPPGLARLIAEFTSAVGVEGATLVGNDTGGGLCQIAVANHPERFGRLVLTPCDAYDNFPPTLFRMIVLGVLGTARVPGLRRALTLSARVSFLRNSPLAFGWLCKHGIDRTAAESYLRPVVSNRDVRRDLAKVIKGIRPEHTVDAARRLGNFNRPVLITWTKEKDFFPVEHGERLARDFPNARLEWVEDSYTFVPEDQPQRLAELTAAFAREPATTAAAQGRAS